MDTKNQSLERQRSSNQEVKIMSLPFAMAGRDSIRSQEVSMDRLKDNENKKVDNDSFCDDDSINIFDDDDDNSITLLEPDCQEQSERMSRSCSAINFNDEKKKRLVPSIQRRLAESFGTLGFIDEDFSESRDVHSGDTSSKLLFISEDKSKKQSKKESSSFLNSSSSSVRELINTFESSISSEKSLNRKIVSDGVNTKTNVTAKRNRISFNRNGVFGVDNTDANAPSPSKESRRLALINSKMMNSKTFKSKTYCDDNVDKNKLELQLDNKNNFDGSFLTCATTNSWEDSFISCYSDCSTEDNADCASATEENQDFEGEPTKELDTSSSLNLEAVEETSHSCSSPECDPTNEKHAISSSLGSTVAERISLPSSPVISIPGPGDSLKMEPLGRHNSSIPFEQIYRLGDVINEGAFGVVYKAHHIFVQPSAQVAVKVVVRTHGEEDDDIISEACILNKIREVSNVTTLFDFYMDDEKLYVVQELAAGGDVFDRLTTRGSYNESDARELVKTLLQTIQSLHNRNIIHRDLKPENLLLKNTKSDSIILLCDFGYAKFLPEDETEGLYTFCGTPEFTAPEIINGVMYRSEVDMWSIGVITFMLLFGNQPFEARTLSGLYELISQCDFAFPITRATGTTAANNKSFDVSQEAKQMISDLLTLDKENRLSASDALECSWFLNCQEEQLRSTDITESLDGIKNYCENIRPPEYTSYIDEEFVGGEDCNYLSNTENIISSQAISIKMLTTPKTLQIEVGNPEILTTNEMDITQELNEIDELLQLCYITSRDVKDEENMTKKEQNEGAEIWMKELKLQNDIWTNFQVSCWNRRKIKKKEK